MRFSNCTKILLFLLTSFCVSLLALAAEKEDLSWDELENWIRDDESPAAAENKIPARQETRTEATPQPSKTVTPPPAPPSLTPQGKSPAYRPALRRPLLPTQLSRSARGTYVASRGLSTTAPSRKESSPGLSEQKGVTTTVKISPAPSSEVKSLEPAPAPRPPVPLPVLKKTISKEPPARNLFVEEFMMNPDQRLASQPVEMNGMLFLEKRGTLDPFPFSVITSFGGSAVRSIHLDGLRTLEDVRKYVRDNLEVAEFEGVEIRKLKVPATGGTEKYLYWVGHKGFDSAQKARAQIVLTRSIAESQGLNFDQMVGEAKQYLYPQIEEPPPQIQTPADFEKQEKVMLKFLDALDIGEKLYGPFHGTAQGEPITWQAFGETTWRQTNLSAKNFADQVMYATNRLVFKGIRAPLNTIDPFVESTLALETNGVDSASHLDLSAGLEWRPFAYNEWLFNYRPWGLPLLEWIQSYRFYVQYFDRKNIKDEIAGSRDYDLAAGVQIFKEWGIDPPDISETKVDSFPEFLRQYTWGEYYGNYRYERTNFGIEDDYNAILWNSSVILGFKTPGLPLPPNPINDEFVLMPYMRFEHVNNTEFSFPYQNQYFVAAGCRWMPFSNFRYKENEWLAKTKLFVEYVGVGRVQNAKQDGESPNAVDWDLRFGLAFSQKRY